MEPSNGSSWKDRSLVDVENVSAFRRGNKIIAVVFILLITSLTPPIAAFIIHLLPQRPAQIPPHIAFCSAVNNYVPACSTFVNRIIADKSVTEPTQILALSLHKAATDLQHIIHTHDLAFNNCSNSLRQGLGRLRQSLAMMRVKPFVGLVSDQENREELRNRMMAAKEDVDSCLHDDLAEFMPEKLVDVEVYLNIAFTFVCVFGSSEMERLMIGETVFGTSLILCGLVLLFMFALFWSLFRTMSRVLWALFFPNGSGSGSGTRYILQITSSTVASLTCWAFIFYFNFV